MPARIKALLETECDTSSNRLKGVLPVLSSLLAQDDNVSHVYLCDEKAVQVYKFRAEGYNFCAYRNIQMLLPDTPDTVLEIQDLIEKAWDAGYNSHGRLETGGIRDTRKHVGTSEVCSTVQEQFTLLITFIQAQALLKSLKIPCKVHAFEGKDAHQKLLDSVEAYFTACDHSLVAAKVYQTNRRPIFLQRPHHSLTIIGFERLRSGSRRLLVFDPAFQPPRALRRLLQEKPHFLFARPVRRSYRKDMAYLRRFGTFETLQIENHEGTIAKEKSANR